MKKTEPLSYLWIRNFISSKFGIGLAFVWGLCEATFFFIVPDVYFSLAALMFPMFGIIYGLVTAAGSIAGGFIMYGLASHFPSETDKFLSMIPGISQQMLVDVRLSLEQEGLKALFHAPLLGIPYKIYAAQAGILKLDWVQLALITIPSRLQRIVLVSCVCAATGKIFQKNIERYPKRWIAGHIIFWVVFYAFYAYRMSVTY